MATQEQIDQAKALYPSLAWMLNVPDLADIIYKAADESWADDRVMGAIEGTTWWQSNSAAARHWVQLWNSDRAEAEKQRDAYVDQINDWAKSVGLKLTDQQLMDTAYMAVSQGWNSSQWQGFVADFAAKGQPATTITSELKSLASQYAVPLSDQTIAQWSQQFLDGSADQNTFQAYLQEQAKSLYPGLGNAIDRGITVAQYVQPYAQIAQQELGVNTAEIDWTNPKWSQAIHQIDAKTGVPVSMSLSDWTRTIRTDPNFGFDQTERAKEQATQLGNGLLKTLGMAA